MIVTYALNSHRQGWPHLDRQKEYNDAKVMRTYLARRGIEFYNISCASWRTRFTIDYASPAHRTATELVMSGCPRTCTLIATEVTK